jgi:hypothetical protein
MLTAKSVETIFFQALLVCDRLVDCVARYMWRYGAMEGRVKVGDRLGMREC